jgi:hypothetical protein
MSHLDIIALTCPACGRQVQVQPGRAGHQVPCPQEGCGTTIDVPAPVQQGFVVDWRVLSAMGLVFVVIAAFLTIKELHLAAGWIVALLLLALAAASEFLGGLAKAGVLVLFALTGLATPTCFFLLHRDPAFYVGTVVFFGLSTYLVVRTRATWSHFDLRKRDQHPVNLESAAVWFGVLASSLAFTWATYFNFLTTLADEHIERRLAFTLFLIVVGVVCSVWGRRSPLPFWGLMGLTYLVGGVAKALAYDTTHLGGFLRIGVFAGGGAVLLLGAALLKKGQPRPTASEA